MRSIGIKRERLTEVLHGTIEIAVFLLSLRGSDQCEHFVERAGSLHPSCSSSILRIDFGRQLEGSFRIRRPTFSQRLGARSQLLVQDLASAFLKRIEQR